ncbi:hypothetical protein Glove_185g45 [Diversispora epigaea]|uniref:Uncharacterized protein n=1 Tax=Diversispora epigaea TaxID=1348612 RepID=A0A397IW12_9GLOM|nr:hypothetical protein Glove_185g45 [Diversispora epigaea]
MKFTLVLLVTLFVALAVAEPYYYYKRDAEAEAKPYYYYKRDAEATPYYYYYKCDAEATPYYYYKRNGPSRVRIRIGTQ